MSENTSPDLKDPAVMLETLRLAYRHALDLNNLDPDCKRLSYEQQRELGRRLAMYWSEVTPPPTAKEREWAHPAESDPLVEMFGTFVTSAQRVLAKTVTDLVRDCHYHTETDGDVQKRRRESECDDRGSPTP